MNTKNKRRKQLSFSLVNDKNNRLNDNQDKENEKRDFECISGQELNNKPVHNPQNDKNNSHIYADMRKNALEHYSSSPI